MNPAKAKLLATAADWRWSSTLAHLLGRNDELVTVKPLLDRIEDVLQFLNADADPALEDALVKGQTVGRALMGKDELVSLKKRNKTPATASAAWSPEGGKRKMRHLYLRK